LFLISAMAIAGLVLRAEDANTLNNFLVAVRPNKLNPSGRVAWNSETDLHRRLISLGFEWRPLNAQCQLDHSAGLDSSGHRGALPQGQPAWLPRNGTVDLVL
jgi:hypothetical protein